MNNSSINVLIVDDEISIRTSLSEFLQDFDYQVDSAESAEIAIEMISAKKYNVVIVDLRLPSMSGDLLIIRASEIDSAIKFLIHTGSVEFALSEELVKLGMTKGNIFLKPMPDLMKICDYIDKITK